MPPLRTYLISKHRPFLICPVTQSLTTVDPILDFYTLSQPDPRFSEDGCPPLPREIVDRIIDYTITGYLERKEFGFALQLIYIDRVVTWRWYRNYINLPMPGVTDKYLCRMKICALSQLLYLLFSLFELGFEEEVFPEGLDGDDDETNVLEPERDIPVIGVRFPIFNPLPERVAPHYLVSKRPLISGRSGKCSTSLTINAATTHLRYNPFQITFEGFENEPTTAWTGRRVCDLMVLDAVCRDGFYHARKVLFPVVVMRMETNLERTSDRWKGMRWQWKKFAELVYIAYNKAELYIMDSKSVVIKP